MHYIDQNQIDEDRPLFRNSPDFEARTYPRETTPKQEEEIAPQAPQSPKLDPGLRALAVHPEPLQNECERSLDMSDSAAPLAPDRSAGSGDVAASNTHDAPSLVKEPPTASASKATELQETAALALERDSSNESSAPPRIDSARDSSEKVPQVEKPGLTLNTRPAPGSVSIPPADESIMSSPILSKKMIHAESNTANTLPAVQQSGSPQQEDSSTSHRKESLPPFQQLANLAEAATQLGGHQDVRGPASSGHHHTPSNGSTMPSPMVLHHPPYPLSAQTSPTTTLYPQSARSPTSTISDGHHFASPQVATPLGYYSDRRSSTATEGGRHFAPPVPSLPSQSSSGDSIYGNASSTDGYSTSHTTPSEHNRPILPPPPGMSVISAGGFKCDFDGCSAAPFQTQYLLTSHRNVHSQNRPHYCPVAGCPRSEGGKGFKRKNEMIRHGLVHSSPGYICPFCPDREHKYPRPDNLQR